MVEVKDRPILYRIDQFVSKIYGGLGFLREKGQRRPFAPDLGFDLGHRDPAGITGLRKNR
jgi:hypothetical protein